MYTTSQLLSQIPGIRHAYFDRTGGQSQGLLSSLNFALNKGDSVENVIQNRRMAMKVLGVSHEDLSCLTQIHSDIVHVIEAPLPFMQPDVPSLEGDALVTQTPGLAIGVLTADCVPVLLSDEAGRVVAAVHAGWRGTLAGVLEKALGKMRDLGAQNIYAAIGPSIQQKSYEVGAEVYSQFQDKDPGTEAFFKASSREGKYMMDLPGLVERVLTKMSVNYRDKMALDTYSLSGEYFSCRRAAHKNEKVYGCHLSAISIR